LLFTVNGLAIVSNLSDKMFEMLQLRDSLNVALSGQVRVEALVMEPTLNTTI